MRVSRSNQRTSRTRWGRSQRRGQALVETALAAPFLVLLLVGGAQVGEIAYSQVSLDTAAREGARAGVAQPNRSVTSAGSPWYPSTQSHTCLASDFAQSTGNPICVAVFNSSGYLDQGAFTNGSASVTITVVPSGGLSSFTTGTPQIRLMNSTPTSNPTFPCQQSTQADVLGTVSGIPANSSATLIDSNHDSGGPNNVTSTSPDFQWCVTAKNSVPTEIITAQVGPAGCGGYSGSVTLSVSSGQTYSNTSITVSPNACTTTSSTTSTTSSTTTATTTSSTSTSTSTTSTSTLSSGPTVSCTADIAPSDGYFTVTISYPVPIFVPFINTLFQTAPGVRTVTTSVTYAIDPSSMTCGA